MTIRFWCPNPACNKALSAKEERVGRQAKCPACEALFTIPQTSTRSPSSAAATPPVTPAPAQAPTTQSQMVPPSLETPPTPRPQAAPPPQAQTWPPQLPQPYVTPQQQQPMPPPYAAPQMPQQPTPIPYGAPQGPQQPMTFPPGAQQMAQMPGQQMMPPQAPPQMAQTPGQQMMPPPGPPQFVQAPQPQMAPTMAAPQPGLGRPISLANLILALVGAGILLLGTLALPIKSAFPLSWGYFSLAWPEATVVCLCAAAAITLALTKMYRLLLIPGGASLAAIIVTIVRKMPREVKAVSPFGGGSSPFGRGDSPFGGRQPQGLDDLARGFADAMNQAFDAVSQAAPFVWFALIVLMIAAVLIVVAGVLPAKKAEGSIIPPGYPGY